MIVYRDCDEMWSKTCSIINLVREETKTEKKYSQAGVLKSNAELYFGRSRWILKQ